MLGGPESLSAAHTAWTDAPAWQELRRYVEDTLVTSDWFELYLAQNVVLDGVLFPLVYGAFDTALSLQAGPTVSMLLRFPNEWFAETSRWVDATLKTAAAESDANRALLSGWFASWRERAVAALTPVAELALGDGAAAALAGALSALDARAAKAGLAVG